MCLFYIIHVLFYACAGSGKRRGWTYPFEWRKRLYKRGPLVKQLDLIDLRGYFR